MFRFTVALCPINFGTIINNKLYLLQLEIGIKEIVFKFNSIYSIRPNLNIISLNIYFNKNFDYEIF